MNLYFQTIWHVACVGPHFHGLIRGLNIQTAVCITLTCKVCLIGLTEYGGDDLKADQLVVLKQLDKRERHQGEVLRLSEYRWPVGQGWQHPGTATQTWGSIAELWQMASTLEGFYGALSLSDHLLYLTHAVCVLVICGHYANCTVVPTFWEHLFSQKEYMYPVIKIGLYTDWYLHWKYKWCHWWVALK